MTIGCSWKYGSLQLSVAVIRTCAVKKTFVKTSQIPQEKTEYLSYKPGLRYETLLGKETPTQLFSYKFCEIFMEAFFTEHLRWLLLNCIDHYAVTLERIIDRFSKIDFSWYFRRTTHLASMSMRVILRCNRYRNNSECDISLFSVLLYLIQMRRCKAWFFKKYLYSFKTRKN